MKLYDVGRHVNIRAVLGELSGTQAMTIPVTRDTTETISFPKPLLVDVESAVISASPYFKAATLKAKIYEDGVISFIARLAFEGVPMDDLATLKAIRFKTDGQEFEMSPWIEHHYKKMLPRIKQFIDKEYYDFVVTEPETYAAYCITDDIGDPQQFIQARGNYIAAFLQGDNPALRYHPNQIKSTLDNPFSYMENDLAIFDIDRCIIFDPGKDYEDLLLVAELANYQVLQLSTLDKVLDHELDVAEDDLRKIFSKRWKPIRALGRKAAELKKLRVDMVFLLENIENSSKIIGEYYLAQIHAHLGSLFKLPEWSTGIRNRLDALEDIYDTARSDTSDSLFMALEVYLALLFGMEFVFFLIGLG